MKKKNLYIVCGLCFTACMIYIFASFTNPTKKEQEQSVLTNALQLVDDSFRDIAVQDKTIIIEDNSFLLSSIIPETDNAITKEDGDAGTISICSLTDEEMSKINSSEELHISAKEDTTDAASSTTKSDKKEKAKKADEKKKDKKDTKQKDEDQILTIMSIGNKVCDDEDIAISTASSYVNIRKEANTDSKILGKLYKDNAAKILSKEGDWYHISSGNIKGYIKGEFLATGLSQEELNQYGTLVATVLADGLNVRKTASTDADRVDVIYNNEKYPVLKQKEDWVKIHIEDDNIKGYVKSEFVQLTMAFNEAISTEEENALKQAEENRKAAELEKKNHDKLETVQISSTDCTTDEVKLLACLVHAEAGNQSYEGKLAVANVVLNRVRSSRYPNSIKSVIYQKGQFTVASSGSLSKQLSQYENFKSSSQQLSIQAAKDALAGVNNIGNRLSFNRYRASVAKKHSKNGVKIDDQFFW